MDIESKIRGGMWGVLVADALGVPHEFKNASAIPAHIGMTMPADYRKTYPRVDYGTWSDDGSLTLALADTLATQGRLDLNHFAKNLMVWFEKGRFTVDGKAFDVGNTTQEAILRLMRGHSPDVSGLDAETSNGNGSLMRALPLAMWHKGDDDALYKDACAMSGVTHRHDVAKAACGVYCVAARHMLHGHQGAAAWIEGLRLAHVKLDIPAKPQGSGYVLDSLSYAIAASRSGGSYRDVVINAIRLGADTDTTACIAGGLIGLRDGEAAIPSEWMSGMRETHQAEAIITKFTDACNTV